MLVRLARQAELAAGQQIEKECYGSKLLVVRHPTNGSVSVLDAHCFHMGTSLAGGDIEDLDGRACIVCPAHKYRIDLATGCRVETDLHGRVCAGAEQKQRVYRVHTDDDFIFVYLPARPDGRSTPLASDLYNQSQELAPVQRTPQRTAPPQSYGLSGRAAPAAEPEAAPPLSPLQPYADYVSWPVMPGGGDAAAGSPQLVLSQEGPISPAPTLRPPRRIEFPAERRADAPHVARRKAATAAILQKAYRPPTADNTPTQSPMKAEAFAAAMPAAVRPAAATRAPAAQKTLFESWGARAVGTAGGDAMDTD